MVTVATAITTLTEDAPEIHAKKKFRLPKLTEGWIRKSNHDQVVTEKILRPNKTKPGKCYSKTSGITIQ